MAEAKRKIRPLDILLLQGNVLIFALSSLMMKLAGGYPFLSWGFVLCYGGGIVLLGIYAIFWQQFLKRMPLSVAYANRAMSMLWTMVLGALFFQETVRWNMILGAGIIAAGILIMVNADEA